MRSKLLAALLSSVLSLILGVASASFAADPPKEKVTYQDHVSGIFRARCGSCHNPDKAKGGLNLESYSAAMQGGGSGKVVEPGDADASTLFLVVAHREEPKMPPGGSKIPDAELDVIRKWIEGGALENSGSTAAVKAKPKFEFKLDPAAMGKPSGTPAMPENLSTEPVLPNAKPNAVVAMATSPWAPLIAVAGHKQVLLYRSTDQHLVGVLPFPEGTVYSLKFSRNGDLLLAGGGRGGQSGLAVAWDVKKGTRVFEIGKEYDVVLAADISPDHGQVALGGPSKVVRIFNTADGSLAFELRKHTEWITAIEFSPDGVLLASGDRNNGLIAWEAATGREFFDLRGHQAAITDISWRLDSNVVASSSEDGTVRLWELENGGNIKTFGAHGGGVASVRFAKDGRLLTAGRDRLVRLWDQNGGKLREFEGFGDLALEAVLNFDETRVVGADWTGEIRVWDIKDGHRIANLAVNPASLAVRLDRANQALAAAKAEAETLEKQLAPLQANVANAVKVMADAQARLAAAEQTVGKQVAMVPQLEAAQKAKSAVENEAKVAFAGAEKAAAQASAALAAAEKTLATKTQEEKSAADALAVAKAATEKTLADKSSHDQALTSAVAALKAAATADATVLGNSDLAKKAQKAIELIQALATAGTRQASASQAFSQATNARTTAAKAVDDARALAKVVALGLNSARDAVTRATQERTSAEKTLADARTALQTAQAAVETGKKQLAEATAAKAGAEKALADRRPPVDAAIAKFQGLKAEADALATEKKRSDAAKGGLAAATGRKP
jgi:hypothetical protein